MLITDKAFARIFRQITPEYTCSTPSGFWHALFAFSFCAWLCVIVILISLSTFPAQENLSTKQAVVLSISPAWNLSFPGGGGLACENVTKLSRQLEHIMLCLKCHVLLLFFMVTLLSCYIVFHRLFNFNYLCHMVLIILHSFNIRAR